MHTEVEIHTTNREQEVIDEVLKGLSNAAIASNLCMSEKSVKGHLTSIYKKFRVKSRTELIMRFHKQQTREV